MRRQKHQRDYGPVSQQQIPLSARRARPSYPGYQFDSEYGFQDRYDPDHHLDYSNPQAYWGQWIPPGTGSHHSATEYDMSRNSFSNVYGQQGQHYGKGPKGYRRSDDRLREDVSDALYYHGGVDASEVEVSVKEGVVTLSGKVDSRQMKRMAEDCAEGIPGVQDVKNEIMIQASSSRTGSFPIP